jgi:hypothetical protein
MRYLFAVALVALVAGGGACDSLPQDPESEIDASPLGSGQRIANVQSPASVTYQQALANPKGANVDVSSVVVTWVDTFDETMDGKSKGTVYVQDVGSVAPYAAISVYKPNYVPAELRPLPGDVLDMVGPYQELPNIGAAKFNQGTTLPQLAQPVGTFRYEFRTPDPLTISLSDIDESNYGSGRQWEGMVVTIEDVTVAAGSAVSGRVSYPMSQADASLSSAAAVLSNELYDLKSTDFAAGTHFKSVTGIVTWFYSYHLAPRSAADLVLAQ